MSMEKLLNPYDKEYMKMAMLKHEEAFREQVYELHRLYRIQKMLMKDIANPRGEDLYHGPASDRPEARLGFDLERPAIEDDHSDLELTLGTRSYSQRKIITGRVSDCGPSFPSSFSSGSNHAKRNGSSTRDGLKWGIDQMAAVSSNQDKLNKPPWLFQALSLNMT